MITRVIGHCLVWLAVLAAPGVSQARIAFGGPPSEDTIVQRGASWRVSGTSGNETVVALRLGELRIETQPSGGRWSVDVPVPARASGPIVLTIEGTQETRRVLAGDIWLCSGQSNMALSLQRAQDGKQIEEGLEAIDLRWKKVFPPGQGRAAGANERWHRPGAAGMRAFSAVCLAFGKALQRRIGVPVGVIDASLGGSRIEAWISATSLPGSANEDDSYRRHMEQDDGRNKASLLFESMISGLTIAPIRGVLWYQGEANRHNATAYEALLGRLMADWRRNWRIDDLPFVVMQLPGFGTPGEGFDPYSPMAAVREAQRLAVARDARAALVTTIDLGDRDLHPLRKQAFGERAAEVAQRGFDQADRASGAVLKAVPAGDRLTVDLRALASCVEARGPMTGSVRIAGADQQWHVAEAELTGMRLVARSARVPRPLALRYGWADWPPTPLLDCSRGVPLTPFRTDDFPVARP